MVTTIKVQEETHEALKQQKQAKESFDDVVRRLANVETGSTWTEQELREIAREIANEQIAERVVPEAQR